MSANKTIEFQAASSGRHTRHSLGRFVGREILVLACVGGSFASEATLVKLGAGRWHRRAKIQYIGAKKPQWVWRAQCSPPNDGTQRPGDAEATNATRATPPGSLK